MKFSKQRMNTKAVNWRTTTLACSLSVENVYFFWYSTFKVVKPEYSDVYSARQQKTDGYGIPTSANETKQHGIA